MLSDIELAQIRSDIGLLMPDTCSILALTLTSDGAGGWTEAPGTVASNVPCRMDFTAPGKEAMSSASLKPFKTGLLSLAYDRTITTANQVVHNSVTYNVIGVNTNQSWMGETIVAVERVP